MADGKKPFVKGILKIFSIVKADAENESLLVFVKPILNTLPRSGFWFCRFCMSLMTRLALSPQAYAARNKRNSIRKSSSSNACRITFNVFLYVGTIMECKSPFTFF